jgi:mono/diheme cytochrome c family protein
MPQKPRSRLLLVASAGIACGAAAVAAAAAPGPSRLVGDPDAGRAVFVANCSACHTLKSADAHGQIGPNLDTLSLSESTIIEQVRNGDPVPTGKAPPTTQMVAYEGVLSSRQIDNVAAFVYTAQHR